MCHLFPARKQVKPTIQPLYSSQLVPDGASSLLQVRNRSSSGYQRQSRVRQAGVNSRSSFGTDKAVSVPNNLYTEDHGYKTWRTTPPPRSPGLMQSRSGSTTCPSLSLLLISLLFYSLNRQSQIQIRLLTLCFSFWVLDPIPVQRSLTL